MNLSKAISVTLGNHRPRKIRTRFDEHIEIYAAHDERLTVRFSGCTGNPGFLSRVRDERVRIERPDMTQVPGRIDIGKLT